jgi:hypothetical protein
VCEGCVRVKIKSMESVNALNENPIIAGGATTTELGGWLARFSSMPITAQTMNEELTGREDSDACRTQIKGSRKSR